VDKKTVANPVEKLVDVDETKQVTVVTHQQRGIENE